MQLGSLARQQIVGHDLPQERVTEGVEALLVGHHELRGDRLADRHARVDVRSRGEDLVVQPPARGEQAEQLLRVGREPFDAQHQRVAQRRRQRPAAVHARRQQLLGKQRIALRAHEQAIEQVVAGRLAEDVAQLLGELLARQRMQLHPARAGIALELGEQRPQRVAAVQLVRAVAGDHEHALAAQRRSQIDEEGARGAVGPVQVLDRQQQALLAGQQLQQLEQRVEQPRLRGGLVVRRLRTPPEPGEDLREGGAGGLRERGEGRIAGAGERAQGADDRRVRQLALPQLDAVAADHADVLGLRGLLELAQQARLADAGLAGHEGQRRPSADGFGQPRPQLLEL